MFSCIFVVYWYEINKWIDDYDKVYVLIFKKGEYIYCEYKYVLFFLFIYFLYEFVYLFFFFRIENYRLVVKVIIDNKVFYIIFYIYYRGKCCYCCGVLDM